MRISGIGGRMSQTVVFSNADQETKSLQKQIAEKQKQLQELSSNEEMSMEEKMKKRQDIQKEITELNNQLRQHQIEQRNEKQLKRQNRQTCMERKRIQKLENRRNCDKYPWNKQSLSQNFIRLLIFACRKG